MSFAEEQHLLISHSRSNTDNNNNNPNHSQSDLNEPSPSPESIKSPPSAGLFAKLRPKSRQYSRINPVMEEKRLSLRKTLSDTPANAESQQTQPLPLRNVSSVDSPQQLTPQNEPAQVQIELLEDDDKFIRDLPTSSKDDLDLYARMNALSMSAQHHQPRASAVNPISIPFTTSQRQILLDTDFDNTALKNRVNRSYSQDDKDLSSAATSPTPERKTKITFDKNIVVYEDERGDARQEVEEKKATDMLTSGVDEGETKVADNESRPGLPRSKSTEDGSKRVSVKDVFSVKKKESKQTALPQINESGDKKKKATKRPRILKKDKSILFDAFKKDRKPDLSNIKNLPISLKTHLADDASDHAIQMILDHIRDLDEQNKEFIYVQLLNDKEFIPRICNKLLEATEAKHNEIVCIWLYEFFKENNSNARLFALQFVPCLIWCVMTRPPKCVSGVVAALLSLYKKECAIFERLNYDGALFPESVPNINEDVSDLLRRDNNNNNSNADGGNENESALQQSQGVSNQHNIFPKFEMPDLDLPSIYHEPNTNTKTPTAPKIQQMNVATKRNNEESKDKEKAMKDAKEIRELVFPALNQANLSTNLHLIYVALQVFNHYITRLSKSSLCLEQMCAVIARLCASGLDASQPLRFPDYITSAWEWKWYTDDLKEKQTEKYILPSAVMSQFLHSIRYSLQQPKTKNIAKFALGQVHRRGHIDMIPEVILQTTSMLHTAFMDGLTF